MKEEKDDFWDKGGDDKRSDLKIQIESVVDVVADKVHHAGIVTGERAQQIQNRAGEKSQQWRHRTDEVLNQVKDRTQEKTSEINERLSEMYDHFNHKLNGK